VFTVEEAIPKQTSFESGNQVSVDVHITSNLVEELTVDRINLTAVKQRDMKVLQRQASQSSQSSLTKHSRQPSDSSLGLSLYSRLHETIRTSSLPLDIVEFIDFKPDGQTMSACGIVCHSLPVSQVDNVPTTVRERSNKRRTDSDIVITVNDVILQPGDNVVCFSMMVSTNSFNNYAFGNPEACKGCKLRSRDCYSNGHVHTVNARCH
jgi:hypothetical protein